MSANTPPRPIILANSAIARTALAFLAWWANELSALVPRRLSNWWYGTSNTLLLTLSSNSAYIERLVPTTSKQGSPLDVLLAPEGTSTSPHLSIVQRFGQQFRLFLSIRPDDAIKRTVVVPLALEENLRESLGYELDRFTPFKQDQVYFDYRILERMPDKMQLRIELALVQRSALDPMLERASTLGLPVSGALLKEPYIDNGSYSGFLSHRTLSNRSSSLVKKRWGLVAFTALLLVAALLIPVIQKRSTAIALLEPMSQAKAEAEHADRLRNRMEKLIHDINFPVEQKWETPSVLLIIEEVTKTLPDDTFVSRLEFNGKEIQLQGESASAAGLVGLLENSKMFKEVSFKSPLTKIQGTPNDRFHIVAAIREARPPHPMTTSAPVVTLTPQYNGASTSADTIGGAESKR